MLVIVPSPKLYPYAEKRTSVFRRYFEPDGEKYRSLPSAIELRASAVTWVQIQEILNRHATHRRVADYLAWRLRCITSYEVAQAGRP